jgi:hypothetical protein
MPLLSWAHLSLREIMVRCEQLTGPRLARPRPASAGTTAGRSFERDNSPNGNRTSTTAPAADGAMPGPPLPTPNLPLEQAHSGEPFR